MMMIAMCAPVERPLTSLLVLHNAVVIHGPEDLGPFFVEEPDPVRVSVAPLLDDLALPPPVLDARIHNSAHLKPQRLCHTGLKTSGQQLPV